MKVKSVLPDDVRALPLAEKIRRLELLGRDKDVWALDVLATGCLEQAWPDARVKRRRPREKDDA